LLVLDGSEQIEGDDLFNVPRDGFSLKLAEADIDIDVLVFEGDDGNFGVDASGEIPDDLVFFE
jgi:hypothetical protein